MALDPIHAFYCTKKWREFAHAFKAKSNGICAHCHKPFDIADLSPHHKTELTLENINDINITFNPANIEVICDDCHNITHNRFVGSNAQHSVYIVHGAPYSGKKTYVKDVATPQDLIVDLDALHCAISTYPTDTTKKTAFILRDALIDCVRMRKGSWRNAYIIGAYPQRFDRDKLASDLGAELIHIDTTKDECVKRVLASNLNTAEREAFIGYIENYFGRYSI